MNIFKNQKEGSLAPNTTKNSAGTYNDSENGTNTQQCQK